MSNNNPPVSEPLYRPVQRTPWSSDSHPNVHADTAALPLDYPPAAPLSPGTILQTTFPTGSRSLAGIAVRAGLLGATFSSTLIYTVYLFNQSSHFWRVPFFLAALSLFHFLEFWCTAQYNPLKADIASFLLSTNGWAYNMAHTCAVLECLFWYTFFPDFRLPLWPASWHYPLLGLGLAMLVMGQAIRSAAMIVAGTSFNHTVQFTRKSGHDLVTNGVFAFFRHPSYFGFFWWGLATQMVLGNILSFLVYAVVLWLFFRARIEREEDLLVKFFGQAYEDYRARTWIWIPFITWHPLGRHKSMFAYVGKQLVMEGAYASYVFLLSMEMLEFANIYPLF